MGEFEEAFLVMQNLGLDNAALGQMYSNNPESRWINRHQMSLCGKCDGHTADDFVKLAKFAGIRHYAEIIEQVRDAVSCWQEIAKDCGVRKNHVKEIGSNLL